VIAHCGATSDFAATQCKPIFAIVPEVTDRNAQCLGIVARALHTLTLKACAPYTAGSM
jgi:hypothetical protein